MEKQSTMQDIAESVDSSSTACKRIRLFGKWVSHGDGHQDEPVNSVGKTKSMEIIVVSDDDDEPAGSMDHGYASAGQPVPRNKGVPWTKDEHAAFLTGLNKIGKGDWIRISEEYVPSRTPTQAASHAQKYFLRLNATQEKAKHRSSIFDMPLINEPSTAPIAPAATTFTQIAPIAPATPFIGAPIAPATNFTEARIAPIARRAPATTFTRAPATTFSRAPATPFSRAPIVHTTTSTRPPMSCMPQAFNVQGYLYMHKGYNNDKQVLSFVPMASFPIQSRAYPRNADGPNVTQLEPRLR